MNVKVKICGLTRPDDVIAACQAGTNFVGVVVEVEKSPRSQSRAVARSLFAHATVPPVVVTKGKEVNELISIFEFLNPSSFQLHGDETPEFVAGLKRQVRCEIWKALPLPSQAVGAATELSRLKSLLQTAQAFIKAGCDALVLDAETPKGFGGTGILASWDVAAWLVERLDVPCFLAGGLMPDNVANAIATVKPWGVDVSSGVEIAIGIKDAEKVRLFCQRAKGVKR